MASESKAGLESDAAFMDLYSRQIGAYGLETMAKLVTMRVLIVGVKGVGVEAAKNLALAGPGAITLCDPAKVEMRHLGANFFLRPEDVGKPIATCVAPRLRELNKGVKLTIVEDLTEEVVGGHDIVLFTEGKKSDLLRWNKFCREHSTTVKDPRGGSAKKSKPIAFIACLTFGPSGFIFSDFGPEFTVRDANGEPPVTRIITNISCEKEGVVTLLPQHEGGRLHGLPESDHDGWVEFSDVKGMFAQDEATHRDLGLNINHSGHWRASSMQKTIRRNGKEVKVFDGFRVKIGDTSRLSPYMGGGTLTQVKRPIVMKFRSLAENLLQPVAPGEWGLLFTDGAKFGRGEQLHFAMQAVMDYEEESKEGARPAANDAEAAEAVVTRAKALVDACKTVNKMCGDGTALAVEELDEDVARKVALYSGVEVQPVACFFGGVVAQEVVKLTGKFTPLNQWVHLDFFEALPDSPPAPADAKAAGSRYDDLYAIWGKKFHDEVLSNARTFMVGCGALGCELLKNFALLGVATGPEGLITTTDNDRIEVSNLNRQFLFREHNVGQAKSIASRGAAIEMNPALKVDAKEILVEPKTETTFNDKFWRSLHFVTNALDNVKARNYVDSRCVFFGTALLESGTLGTKCNNLTIVPHMTQSYTDGPQDGGDDDAIPMCTLRNFPSLIEHCIEWSRAQFTDMFVEPATAAMNYVADPKAYLDKIEAELGTGSKRASKIAQTLPALRSVKRMIDAADGATMEKCIKLASAQFHDLFRDKIKNLITSFPEHHKTEDGTPFWSGAKRFPKVTHLDLDNELHMQFLISTANILATNLGLVPPPPHFVAATDEKRNPAYFKKVLGTVAPPPFRRSNSNVATHEDESDEADEADEKELAELMGALRARDVSAIHIEPADFEKDQDANFHIDFIAAAANLRADNYSIRQASRHKCKMIAGKIIPAIATTTAAVTGLVMLEMLKVLQKKPLEAYKGSSNNLGTNQFLFSEPLPPEKAKKAYSHIEMAEVTPIPDGFTKWDKTMIEGADLTVRQFLDKFKEKTGVNCEMLFAHADSGKFIVPGIRDSEMDDSLRAVVRRIYGDDAIPEGATYMPFNVSCEDDEGESYIVPQVVYSWA